MIKLEEFTNIIYDKVCQIRMRNEKPEHLILDRETFMGLKRECSSYGTPMVYAHNKKDVNEGDSFMGLTIAITTSNKTTIIVA